MFENLLISLATWRLVSLIRDEDGPYEIFSRFRDWSGLIEFYEGDERIIYSNNTLLSQILECFWCTSIWVSAILSLLAALFGFISYQEVLFSILANSAISIIIEEKVFK